MVIDWPPPPYLNPSVNHELRTPRLYLLFIEAVAADLPFQLSERRVELRKCDMVGCIQYRDKLGPYAPILAYA